ncbi:MAG TPA: hypothetical protein VG367_06780 [Mucilaginibacter sp.]|jgi:hypothetical protein|nr:hypothetical protein [Mucilaginibacter sp.]
MKNSRFAAKLVTRLFFLLALFAIIPLFKVDHDKFSRLYFVTNHKWIWIFPCVLAGSFITLFVGCTIQRYSKPDWNWLLVVNTIVLLAYGVSLYIRVLHLVS